MIQALDHPNLKHSFATRAVPLTAMAGLMRPSHRPQVGQLLVAEVIKVGKNSTLEDRAGVAIPIFPGDRIVGSFGNRYATHQFEGYVPTRSLRKCDLLSIGGVCGKVASQHAGVRSPTRLRVLGLVCDRDGQPVNQRAFALPLLEHEPVGQVILVVGASMNAGKTTVGGMLVHALSRAGLRVAAAKVTGTSACKDDRLYQSCGARPVLDFIDAGYPSTYMLDLGQLLMLHSVLLSQLRATRPDFIVLELADGLFQRETRMLLENDSFRATIDHVFFAANDSLSAESGVRHLRKYGLPPRAISGMLTQSPLAIREAEETTGVPCLSVARLREGDALELLGVRRTLEPVGGVKPIKAVTKNGTAHKDVVRADQVLRLLS